MGRRHLIIFIALGIVTAVAVVVFGGRPSPAPLWVATWGGTVLEAQRRVFFDPFTAATGRDLALFAWDGSVPTLNGIRRSGHRPYDRVQIESEALERACDAGAVLPFDPAGAVAVDRMIAGAVHPCGVAGLEWSTVLAWRGPDPGPRSWADLWDAARVPGRVALRRSPRHTLEIALLADGVAADEVYALLRKDAGVVRALDRLAALGQRVRWWRAGAEPVHWLVSGEVQAAAVFRDRLAAAESDPAVRIVAATPLAALDYWAVPKGAWHGRAVRPLIAGLSDPERQRAFAALTGYAPTHRAARPPAEEGPRLAIDAAFWAEHGLTLTRRFEAWLEGRDGDGARAGRRR